MLPPAQPVHGCQTFPAAPEQVRQARCFLAAILGQSPLADDALTCLSELASNAVLHSASQLPGGTFTVRATWASGRLRVEVSDQGGPWAPTPSHGVCTGGRGLTIVAALADHWGISPTTTATTRTAWFEMTLP